MAKSIIMVLGVLFIIIGVLGYFNNPVLGVFEVDTLQNIFHILSGVVAIAMAAIGQRAAKFFAKTLGLIYGLVAILGFILGTEEKLLGLMQINTADNFLHLLLAVVLLFVGFKKLNYNHV